MKCRIRSIVSVIRWVQIFKVEKVTVEFAAKGLRASQCPSVWYVDQDLREERSVHLVCRRI